MFGSPSMLWPALLQCRVPQRCQAFRHSTARCLVTQVVALCCANRAKFAAAGAAFPNPVEETKADRDSSKLARCYKVLRGEPKYRVVYPPQVPQLREPQNQEAPRTSAT